MSTFKRLSALIVAAVLSVALVSCGDDKTESTASEASKADTSVEASADTSTEASADESAEASTEASTDESAEASADESTEASADESTAGDDVFADFPAEECITWKGYNFHMACGEFMINSLGDIETATDDNIAVVLGDTFKTGKISATLVANGGDEADNDNGIIFGLEDIPLDYFWEADRPYYFLFVSDDCSLYLAKVAYNDQPWTPLVIEKLDAKGIIYSHGSPITIAAEVLDGGVINCYADGQLVFSYTDADPLEGEGYGIRGEWQGVSWQDLVVEKN